VDDRQAGNRQQAITHDGSASVDRALLDALLHHVDATLVAIAADGTITWTSDNVRQLLGLDRAAVLGRNVLDFMHPDDIHEAAQSLERWQGRPGAARGTDYRVRHANGTWIDVRYDTVSGSVVAPLGEFLLTLRAAEAGRDHLEELRARDTADARIVRLASLFLHRGTRPFATALDDALEELSGLEWLTRLSVWTMRGERAVRQAVWSAVIDQPALDLPRSFPLGYSTILRPLLSCEEVHLSGAGIAAVGSNDEADVVRAAGITALLAVPLVLDDACTGVILAESALDGAVLDATHVMSLRSTAAILAAAFARDEVERDLERRARTDALTGLPNRFAFDESLQTALAAMDDVDGAGLSVAIIDLDRFKLVNDALGHVAGDNLLADVVQRIDDATMPGTTVARLGGDELLVLHTDTPDAGAALRATEDMLHALDAPFDVDGRPFTLTASAGVAFVDEPSIGAVELLRRADVAMYEAKAAGGARAVAADDGQRSEIRQRLRRESELRSAIESGDVEPYFQGEWDLRTGALIGAEALARWQHPSLGLQEAGTFIPLAEECGLVSALGEHILRAACAHAASWRQRGSDGDFVLRVNLSAIQLREPGMVELVADTLLDTGLPATALCLELTESALLHDPEGAIRTLRQLREVGVGLAVDDFGTGFSSMLYLKRLPVTALKLDQAFVAGLPDDAGDVAIVQAVVHLAGALGLSLTAEGVEDDAQSDELLRLGCHRAQGYRLSRPEPAAGFAARLLDVAAARPA